MYSKSCLSCVNLHIHGYGYSDWTWEGDEIFCAKKLFPTAEQPSKQPTETHSCPCFTNGSPFEVSPDGNIHAGKKLSSCDRCEEN